MISAVKALLVAAAGAEYAAAELWTLPAGEYGGQWGRRQPRREREWERRWRGLAQIQGAQVVWYDHAGFDRSAAVALLEHCQR
jgi:hypothetical protein